MANPVSLRRIGIALAVLALFVVLIVSLYLLATMSVRLDRFGVYYYWLLIANGCALVIIALALGYNTWRLLRDFRGRVAGSRLTLRLVGMSVLLALLPVTLVYSFSVMFLQSNIDSWYDLEIEEALDDALALSQESLGLQMRTVQRVTLDVAERLVGVPDSASVVVLNALSAGTEASEMTLIGPDNRIIASTGISTNISVQPDRPDDDLADRARQGLSYVGVDPVSDGELYIRVVTPVLSDVATRDNAVLQALYPISARSSQLAESVQSSYQNYRRLLFLRQPLKISSILTLTLVLLLSVMMGVWFAFYAGRRMMAPIHDLVEGTRSVADGDYNIRVNKRGDHELGFLVQSFNSMTAQLDRSRLSNERSQQLLERQKGYLQAVLERITSGVMTLDAGLRIRTGNQAAARILEVDGASFPDRALHDGVQAGGIYGQFAEQLIQKLNSDRDFAGELEVYGQTGRRVLFCRVADLVSESGEATGKVVVFDDMTTLIVAQRDAAWSEVARRLAHEIKNPLTPIRLSAERLRLKMHGKLSGPDAELLQRLTETIENQVDAMKAMVNAFAEYASTPNLDLRQSDFNQLLSEVALLYEDAERDQRVELDLQPGLPDIPVDVSRMRQLVHNLIKNSLEAQRDLPRRRVRLMTREVRLDNIRLLEMTASDEGPGFPTDLMGRLFEPYVTSKPKGTGLGLAIVRRIVEEHGGEVNAANAKDGGALVVVRLPMPSNVIRLTGDAA